MHIKKSHITPALATLLFLMPGTSVYAGTMGPAADVLPAGNFYVGAFGGGGGASSGTLRQQGTAFFPDAEGGPLAVNAQGQSNNTSPWIAGGNVGYKWAARALNHINSNWMLAPAAELEGYYLGGTTWRASEINNDTTRLDAHNFQVTYPTRTGVFLVNALLNLNHSAFGRFNPYIGVGGGAAVVSISNATSIQTSPDEPGINHYNSDPNDVSLAFAAQPKVGLSFKLNQAMNMFVEYRFLYLSPTHYTFGSTIELNHAPTSAWDTKIGSQYYNVGTVGLQFD